MKYAAVWLFLVAVVLRLSVLGMTHLDGLYGQDAFAYFNCAVDLLHAKSGQMPCSDFYWPLGYPVLAALFMFLTQAIPFGAQLSSLVCGAAIAPLAYWLVIEGNLAGGHQRDSRSIAVAAALIVAFSGELVMSSLAVMSDAPGLFWATLSACLLLRWGRRTDNDHWQPVWLVLASTALAIAIVTRWIYGGLVFPFAAFVLRTAYCRFESTIVAGRSAPGPAAALEGRRLSVTLLSLAAALLAFLAILLPQLHFSAHSGAPVLKHGWVVNWNPLGALRRSFDNPDGHFDYRWPPVLYYAEPLVHPAYLFPLLTPCALAGVWYLRRNPALIIVGGWIATLYLYLVGVPYENGRFGLAFFTPVAVVAAVGVFRIPLPRLLRLMRSRWLLLALSLLLALPFAGRALVKFTGTVKQQTDAINYVQRQVPAGATVVSFELSISLQHYTSFKIVDLYAQSPQSLRPLVCNGSPAYVYVQTDKLETQWAGKTPAANFHWLNESVGLEQLGRQAQWTLYRVRPCE